MIKIQADKGNIHLEEMSGNIATILTELKMLTDRVIDQLEHESGASGLKEIYFAGFDKGEKLENQNK